MARKPLKCPPSNPIPKFPAISLTTKDFGWLHQEVWDSLSFQYFATNRAALPAQILTPPPTITPPSHPAHLLGRWVLANTAAPPTAWAEAQAFYHRFLSVFLSFSVPAAGEPWQAQRKTPLSLLISAIFILTSADLIHLIPTWPEAHSELEDLGWGETKRVSTLLAGGFFAPAQKKLLHPWWITQIDRVEWWEFSNGKADMATLAYLTKRMEQKKNETKKEIRRKNPFAFFRGLRRNIKKKDT